MAVEGENATIGSCSNSLSAQTKEISKDRIESREKKGKNNKSHTLSLIEAMKFFFTSLKNSVLRVSMRSFVRTGFLK
jgi:hypothetical protein